MVGATLLPANALLMTQGKAQADERHKGKGRLTKGDADLLRFAAWARDRRERSVDGSSGKFRHLVVKTGGSQVSSRRS